MTSKITKDQIGPLESWFRLDGGHVSDLQIDGNIRIVARPSIDCGCPEEEWVFEHTPLLIHFEEDGGGEAVADMDEDLTLTKTFTGLAKIEDLRASAFAWIRECRAGNFSGEAL